MEIEPLYAKLYNKYKLLKEKRFAELDDISKDQEVKFLNYVNAAEDVIKHVRHENEKLRAQVSELRSEVSLIRSTKDDECEQYKNLLVEERQKNKILLEEVERLRNLQNISLHSEDGENATRQLITTELAQVTPTQVTSNSTRRTRRKHAQEANAGMDASSPRNDQDACLVRESANGSPQGALSSGDLENEKQPQCCRRIVDGSGADVEDRRHITCQFQTLIEYLLGMKLCADYQTERKSILALHESSGYSFSLTWVKNESEEGEELMYRVTRLGTFEMMAPEWMRSSLMFSTSMWPIFFERLTRTIKMGSC
ncbi:titan9 [Euphorbia peplus]|nr:titan9 [Euphorbia peplus]